MLVDIKQSNNRPHGFSSDSMCIICSVLVSYGESIWYSDWFELCAAATWRIVSKYGRLVYLKEHGGPISSHGDRVGVLDGASGSAVVLSFMSRSSNAKNVTQN